MKRNRNPPPRRVPPHTHTLLWVNSPTMPGYLVLRCSCGHVAATTPLGRK